MTHRVKIFLSTLSLRRATDTTGAVKKAAAISIHALLAESDGIGLVFLWWGVRFLSTLSLRRATSVLWMVRSHPLFLSTLSLRRATCYSLRHSAQSWHFYPRSPCGERRQIKQTCRAEISISIHALLAESDLLKNHIFFHHNLFLSTLSLRRATGCEQYCIRAREISIHALLAESDNLRVVDGSMSSIISIHALLAESDEQAKALKVSALRISIHALLAESDKAAGETKHLNY